MTANPSSTTYRYRDPVKRRAYLRNWMREKRAKDRKAREEAKQANGGKDGRRKV